MPIGNRQLYGYRSQTLDLKAKASLSVKWNAVAQFVKLGLYFLTSVVLARLLEPADFGLLGMATVFTSFLAVFNDFGLGSAVIQKKDLDQEILSSVFWASVCIGASSMGLSILISPSAAAFYGQDELRPFLSVISVSFLFTSLGQVQLSLLMKRIEFRRIMFIEVSAYFLGSAAAIMLAFLNFGVWSLAIQIIVTSACITFLLWLMNSWRPSFKFSFINLREVIGYSSGLLGFKILNYFSRNADYLLIGKFLGTAPLGQYTFAYRIMQFPIQNITNVINRVLFPTLAEVQDNNEQLKKGFIKTSQLIAFVTFPLMIGVFLLAPELIIVIFGSKWQPAVPVIQILALVGLVQSIGGTVGNIYTAKGKTDWLFLWGLASSLVVVISILIGLRWGIVGVAIGYACANLILLYPSFSIPFRLIDLEISDFLRSLRMQIMLAFSMGMILFISSEIQRRMGLPNLIVLFSNILIGSATYLVATLLYDRITYNELMTAVFGRSVSRIIEKRI